MAKVAAEKPVILTAGDIRAALRLRYAESHALLFEVGNSTGHGTNRHIDALAMGLWPSRGMEVEGIEIKVSRSDWKRELADHEKADAVQRYCDRWWIAAPKGLIPPAELPATWGLLEVEANDGGALTIRVKVQAPKLEPQPLSRGFVAAMLRRAARVDADELRAAIAKETVQITARERSKAQADYTDRVRKAEAVMEKLSAVKAATGIDLLDWKPPSEVVDSIKFAQRSGLFASYGVLSRLRHHADDVIKRIDELTIPQGEN